MSPFPSTWDEMHAAGYRFERRTRCKYCPKEIEWWTTPSGRWIPLDHAPDVGIFYVSHWITCPGAKQAKEDKAEERPAELSKSQAARRKTRKTQSGRLF